MRFVLLALVGLVAWPVWAEDDAFQLSFTPAFRLTCLPGQNFAMLESLWLQRLPKKDVSGYQKTLAAQGIFFPQPLHRADENVPLQASCSLGGHNIQVAMTGNGDITPQATKANDGKPFAYTDCGRVMSLTLQSLKVDGVQWQGEAAFADACLESNILRMRVYPAERRMQVCTQDVGGLLEDGLPDVWYGDIPVVFDMRQNPPTPQVSCKTHDISPSSK